MLLLSHKSPINYALCNQTVTIYHWDGSSYSRTVINNAFLDYKKTQNVDRTGSTETNSFILIIPGSDSLIHVGDKVLMGVGLACATREDWAQLIPSKVPGLVVVKTVDPKYWNGTLVHTEAGG